MQSTNEVRTTVEIFQEGEVGVRLTANYTDVRASYTPDQARELARVIVRQARLAESVLARRKV